MAAPTEMLGRPASMSDTKGSAGEKAVGSSYDMEAPSTEDNIGWSSNGEHTTHRGFKPRHSQMIAIGGAIGTSIFIGTALVLRTGGPLFLLLAYSILCAITYAIMTGIAEVASYMPVHGGTMSFYGHKYVSSSMGFALGYLYWYSVGILVPYELTAVALLVDYWNPGVNSAVWMSILLVIIVATNFLPVRWFGEVEFWSAGMKLVLIVGLILMSFCLTLGGGPDHKRTGFGYWNDPGATNTYILEGDTGRFLAFLRCLALSSFAFVLAPEYMIVTAGEMQSPRYNLPRAAKRYIWRMIILFIPMMIMIGMICPYNDEGLLGAGSAKSPFIVAIKNAGIPVLDSIVNAGIVLSAATAGNAFLYQASRNLYSLAVAGSAPKIFKHCNKHGVPWPAVGASACLSLLAYLSLSSTSLTVFNWLINVTNSSGYISWMCCTYIYMRFRKSCDHHNVEPVYHAWFQPYGIYFAGVMSFILLLLNGFNVFFPSEWNVGDFLSGYIGIPAFLVIYGGHRIYTWREKWVRGVEDIDMFDGMEEVLAAEKPPNVFHGWQKIRYLYE